MYQVNIIFSIAVMFIAASYYYFRGKKIKVWYLLVAALISYPWQLGDNVYSLFGGKNTNGAVYSLVGIYQEAKNSAVAVIGCGYQNAGRDAVQGLSLAVYQNAGQDAVQGLGLAVYQNAGRDAVQVLGLVALYQNAGRDAMQGLGLAVYQNADRNAVVGFGIPVYQKAGNYAGVSWKLANNKK